LTAGGDLSFSCRKIEQQSVEEIDARQRRGHFHAFLIDAIGSAGNIVVMHYQSK
jgi:hypothetical protein